MKKTYTLLLLAAFLSLNTIAQTTYPGNGKTGGGGAVGNGSLTFTLLDTATLRVDFTRGGGNLDDVLVIYIESTTGSVISTKNFIDNSDQLMSAISGYDGTNRSIFNFGGGFKPSYAIALKPGIAQPRCAVVQLRTNPNLFKDNGHPSVINGQDPSAASYQFDVKLKDIGIAKGSSASFKFIATYIRSDAYRYDEAIGVSMDGFTSGWNDYTSTTAPLEFSQTLPAVWSSFTGAFAGKNVQLNWATATELNTKQFDVQKSGDGNNWRNIGTLIAQNLSTGSRYSFLDNNVSDAVTYYQIKLSDKNGAVSYSPVIILRKDGISGITLLGNPARGSVNLNINNNIAGRYNIELYSTDGRMIASQVYNHPGGSGKVSITVPGAVKGACVLRISNGTNTQSMKVVVE